MKEYYMNDLLKDIQYYPWLTNRLLVGKCFDLLFQVVNEALVYDLLIY